MGQLATYCVSARLSCACYLSHYFLKFNLLGTCTLLKLQFFLGQRCLYANGSGTMPIRPLCLGKIWDTSNVHKKSKVEFKKGVSELVAEVEKRLSSSGDLEWVIEMRTEHASSASVSSSSRKPLHQLIRDMHIPPKTYS